MGRARPPGRRRPEPRRSVRKASTVRRPVERLTLAPGGDARRSSRRDVLATEEPLEIRVARPGVPAIPVAVTMRTPGADFELAAGFLFSEGVVERPTDIPAIAYCIAPGDGEQRYNIVQASLSPDTAFDPADLARNFYTTSSCGVCGKASIEAVMAPVRPLEPGGSTVPASVLAALPSRLRDEQRIFDRTGGLHAAALFEPDGSLVRVREDVGRHNAMDKLVGSSLLAGELPLRDRIVLVSGRLSFELVQKAARAGVPVLAGVSAPSSLAVELAEATGVTLVGFLRGDTFNIYSHGRRIT